MRTVFRISVLSAICLSFASVETFAAWDKVGVRLSDLPSVNLRSCLSPDTAVWFAFNHKFHESPLFLQKVSQSGDLLLGARGLTVCDSSSSPDIIDLVPTQDGGVWVIYMNYETHFVYVQRYTLHGEEHFPAPGVLLTVFPNQTRSYKLSFPTQHVIPDGTGGFWFLSRSYTYGNLHLTHVSGENEWLVQKATVHPPNPYHGTLDSRMILASDGKLNVFWIADYPLPYILFYQRIDQNGVWKFTEPMELIRDVGTTRVPLIRETDLGHLFLAFTQSYSPLRLIVFDTLGMELTTEPISTAGLYVSRLFPSPFGDSFYLGAIEQDQSRKVNTLRVGSLSSSVELIVDLWDTTLFIDSSHYEYQPSISMGFYGDTDYHAPILFMTHTTLDPRLRRFEFVSAHPLNPGLSRDLWADNPEFLADGRPLVIESIDNPVTLPSGVMILPVHSWDFDSDENGLYLFGITPPELPTESTGIRERSIKPTVQFDAWPNPFNSTVRIDWRRHDNSRKIVDIYDITGRLVRHLESMGGSVVWNPLPSLSSGVYLLVLRDNQGILQTRRITLLR